jgi:DNA mismatch repair protein MSH6
MAKPTASSPPASSPALKRTTPSTQNMRSQKSILGFFQKSSPATPSNNRTREPASSPAQRAAEQRSTVKPTPKEQKRSFSSFAQDLSPVPSSDLPVPEDEEENGTALKVY